MDEVTRSGGERSAVNSTAALASLRAGARLQGTLYGAIPAPPFAENQQSDDSIHMEEGDDVR